MPLTLVGIDEAGYGPMLGPLCVGMCVLQIDDWVEGSPAPDLWSLLSGAVTRKPARSGGKVAIGDSKKLKLPNDSTSRHPLTHLERGVMAMLATREGATMPTSDAELFAVLHAAIPDESALRDVEPAACPVASSAESLAISANVLKRAMDDAGVSLIDLRCEVVGPVEFNTIVKQSGSKAETTAVAIGRHLRRVWMLGQERGTTPRVVCDRQGGRTSYGAWLAEMLPERLGAGPVVVLEEAAERCRYEMQDALGERRLMVQLQPEAEEACFAVALASMTAKLVRETMMARFNRFWAARAAAAGHAEVKPTAGYVQDGRRWLSEMNGVITPAERAAIVRIA